MIGILANGGQAHEIESYLTIETVAFRAVSSHQRSVSLVDIAAPPAELPDPPVVAAVGAPGLRRLVVRQWIGQRCHTVIAPGAELTASAIVGNPVRASATNAGWADGF